MQYLLYLPVFAADIGVFSSCRQGLELCCSFTKLEFFLFNTQIRSQHNWKLTWKLYGAPPLLFLPPSCFSLPLSLPPSRPLSLPLSLCWWFDRSGVCLIFSVITCPDRLVQPCIKPDIAYTPETLPQNESERPKYFGCQGNCQPDLLESQQRNLFPGSRTHPEPHSTAHEKNVDVQKSHI